MHGQTEILITGFLALIRGQVSWVDQELVKKISLGMEALGIGEWALLALFFVAMEQKDWILLFALVLGAVPGVYLVMPVGGWITWKAADIVGSLFYYLAYEDWFAGKVILAISTSLTVLSSAFLIAVWVL